MTLQHWLGFATTVAIFVALPGPSTLFVYSSAARFGRRGVVGIIAGDLSANIVQMSLAATGVAAIATASPVALGTLKWCGVGYLVTAGLGRLRARTPAPGSAIDQPGASHIGVCLTRGFLVSAANPKAIVFFASIFPLFLVAERAAVPQFLVMMLTFVLMDGLALTGYARLGMRTTAWLGKGGSTAWASRVAGGVLLVAAALLAARGLR